MYKDMYSLQVILHPDRLDFDKFTQLIRSCLGMKLSPLKDDNNFII